MFFSNPNVPDVIRKSAQAVDIIQFVQDNSSCQQTNRENRPIRVVISNTCFIECIHISKTNLFSSIVSYLQSLTYSSVIRIHSIAL